MMQEGSADINFTLWSTLQRWV